MFRKLGLRANAATNLKSFMKKSTAEKKASENEEKFEIKSFTFD